MLETGQRWLTSGNTIVLSLISQPHGFLEKFMTLLSKIRTFNSIFKISHNYFFSEYKSKLLIKYDSRHSNQPNLFYFLEFSLNLFQSQDKIFVVYFNSTPHLVPAAGTVRPCYRAVRRGETREQQHECSRFTFFTFMKQIFCLQKSITYLWIEWGKRNYLNYRNFKNIFMIKDSGNKNLRILVCF